MDTDLLPGKYYLGPNGWDANIGIASAGIYCTIDALCALIVQ